MNNPMQQFEIILKNDKIKWYRTIALINLLLNVSIFAFLLFYDAYRAVALSSILALALYISLRGYVSKKQNPGPFFDEFVFFIPAMCWFGLHSYILMIVLILMGFLYRFTMQQIKFVFTSKVVMKTNFPKRVFDWNLFSNVILKDNILTLDFKNNKLIQSEIETQQAFNEIEFNEFAQSKIKPVENILQ